MEARLRVQERINKLIQDNQLYAVKLENNKQKMGYKNGGPLRIALHQGKINMCLSVPLLFLVK